MDGFGECEKITSQALIVLKEKRSKITLKNDLQTKVRLIQIDGCVIREGPRCDFLVINQKSIEHYIELKGSNVRRALIQIETTIKKVSSNSRQTKKHSFIISTRCPLLSPEIQAKKIYFKRRYNSTLNIKTIFCQASI